jgi:hypothetical protein
MSFFKRALGKLPLETAALPVAPVAAPPPVLVGDLPCGACSSQTGVRCAYADRRGTRCGAAFCSNHHLLVRGEPYCRRHGAVAAALSSHPEEWEQRPDCDNRAPSLVEWVGNLIDAGARQVMLEARGARIDLELVVDDLNLVVQGTPRVRSWQRGWKLVSNTGPALRIALLVEEPNDGEVIVRVDAEVVERVIPPWIAQRRSGETVDPQTDAERRAEFERALIELLRVSAARKQPLG